MNEKFDKGPTAPKVRIEDIPMFGKLLSRSRNALKKLAREVALEISVSNAIINKWEQGESFPEEDKLPAMAKAYGIPLEELKKVFKISKEAREKGKNARDRG